MNSEDFVTYDQAIKLKELGFRGECNHWYRIGDEELLEVFHDPDTAPKGKKKTAYGDFNSGDWGVISAPTLYQARKWLRIEKRLFVYIDVAENYARFLKEGNGELYFFTIRNLANNRVYENAKPFHTPEEALSMGISWCLDKLPKNDSL